MYMCIYIYVYIYMYVYCESQTLEIGFQVTCKDPALLFCSATSVAPLPPTTVGMKWQGQALEHARTAKQHGGPKGTN